MAMTDVSAKSLSSGRVLFWIATVDVLLAVAGSLVTYFFHFADMPLATAFSVATVVTFFGLIHYSNGRVERGFGFREALAASIFTLYLLVVANVIFFRSGDELPPLGRAMLENFTTLTTVVAGFYFGGKAIEGAAGAVLDRRDRRTAGAVDPVPEVRSKDRPPDTGF
jgi:hypothetical protein